MTRRKASPTQAYAWYPGEAGEVSRAVVVVPPLLRARYTATVDIIEPLDHATAPNVLLVTITDRETGAVAEIRGDRITLPTAGTAEAAARLWADVRTIAGVAVKLGRPLGSQVTEASIRGAVAELVKAGRAVRLDTIATTSGVFTYDQLRYYMRVNGRHLRDYTG